jgi:antitoxin PrlF
LFKASLFQGNFTPYSAVQILGLIIIFWDFGKLMFSFQGITGEQICGNVKMNTVEITSSSTKGQIVIPGSIRKQLGIVAGTKLIAMTDGINLLLKPIRAPRVDSFSKLIKESQSFAKKAGVKEEDIKDAIKAVRSGKNKVQNISHI